MIFKKNTKNKQVEVSYLHRNKGINFTLNYQDGREFKEGRAAVKQDGSWYFINTEGKIISDTGYCEVADYKNGFARVSYINNLWGYIDLDGNLVSQLGYYNALDSDGEKAYVKTSYASEFYHLIELI